jgi:menaquinone-9 beta-reductase
MVADRIWEGDVVVVGAGPAGAWAAARLAQGGARVALIDRRPPGDAGAQWVNGLASWLVDEAGAEHPKPPELLGAGHRFTILSPSGKHRIHVDDHPLYEVDMRMLGERMADEARKAGAEMFWETVAEEVEIGSAGRPVALSATRTHEGTQERIRLRASVFVDASGLPAVLRRQVPRLAHACPPPAPSDLCVAAQEVREISDRGGARAFLGKHDGEPEQTLAWTGMEGGYSVLNVRVNAEFSQVAILTGSTALARYRSGRRILDDFVRDNPWIGPRVFGGSRALPLRRPYSRLVAPGIALLGDAACQVYPTHGSGIGIGLVAARMLSDAILGALRRREDPGARPAMWGYSSAFHRRWGALMCGADAFRRFSQSLTVDDVERMLGLGILSPKMVADGLAQRRAALHLEGLCTQLKGMVKAGDLTARLLPVLARLPLIEQVALTYPKRDSGHIQVDIYRYERRMRWLVDSVS